MNCTYCNLTWPLFIGIASLTYAVVVALFAITIGAVLIMAWKGARPSSQTALLGSAPLFLAGMLLALTSGEAYLNPGLTQLTLIHSWILDRIMPFAFFDAMLTGYVSLLFIPLQSTKREYVLFIPIGLWICLTSPFTVLFTNYQNCWNEFMQASSRGSFQPSTNPLLAGTMAWQSDIRPSDFPLVGSGEVAIAAAIISIFYLCFQLLERRDRGPFTGTLHEEPT